MKKETKDGGFREIKKIVEHFEIVVASKLS